MLKHIEIAEPSSCLNKSAPDEPIFVLRAKDPIAAVAVRCWAAAAQAIGHHHQSKIVDALSIADDMDSWRRARQGSQKSTE